MSPLDVLLIDPVLRREEDLMLLMNVVVLILAPAMALLVVLLMNVGMLAGQMKGRTTTDVVRKADSMVLSGGGGPTVGVGIVYGSVLPLLEHWGWNTLSDIASSPHQPSCTPDFILFGWIKLKGAILCLMAFSLSFQKG